MNWKGIFFVAVAAFAGALMALQANKAMEHRFVQGPDMVMLPPKADIMHAALDQADSSVLDFRQAAKKVIPSVVSVDRYERQVDLFGDVGPIAETGTGSGVIVTQDGYIVTNNHVVADASGQAVPQVKVRLNDKRSFTAKVVGTDPRSDIAVLKIDGQGFDPIDMGSSAGLQIGQWVMAVGNPLGFDDTVSVGVVSSLKRNLPTEQGGIVNAIQTDAAINPGNSGGALTDQHGKIVGINAAIASSTGASVGIGFAIPIDHVREVVNDIVKYGHARYGELGLQWRRAWDGVLGDPEARQEIAQQTGAQATSVPTSGMLIYQVAGPAARAGLKPLDVLVSVDNEPTDSYFSLNRILLPKKPGDVVTVKWWSRGEIKTAQVTLQEGGGPIE